MTGNLRGGHPHEEGGVPQPPATEQSQTVPPAPPAPAAPAAPGAPTAPAAPAAPTSAAPVPTPPVPSAPTTSAAAPAPPAAPSAPASPAPASAVPPAPSAASNEAPAVPAAPAAPAPPSAAPAAPSTLAAPAAPSVPSAPSAPAVPPTPPSVNAHAPAAPGAPSASAAPSVPSAPGAPNTAAAPSAPAAPGAPSAKGSGPSAPAAQSQVQSSGKQEPQKTQSTKAKPQASEDKKYGPFTLKQWIGGGLLAVLGLAVVLAAVVFGSRYFFSTDFGADFLNRYDGHSSLPESAPVGIPAWLSWQHFFNLFFMVLIIRTGLQIRYERKPSAYVTPKLSKKKISLTMWFHLSLDILWVVNGLIFIILLFVTGHWMRVVPTSWDVFPNALSAGLQYLTLDWPTENGWVNYNALQLLSYFVTIFIAAPLAIISGFRLSSFWSKKWTKASQFYPAPVARKIHVPVMLYFVIFIVIHVVLVVSTGMLRNLNSMFAAQGDVDPSVYANNWTGFFFFLGALVVIAAAWVAARPMVLAPVARLFGKVTAR